MPLVRKSTETATVAALGPAAIANKLSGGSDDERWIAARDAANIPDSAQALGDALLKERDARVREAIFTSLARIASAESVGFLLTTLRSGDAALRNGTLDALKSMKGQVSPYILQLLQDGDADIRLLACELVQNLPGKDAEVLLCDLLDVESQPNVCSAAIEVLAEVGSARALPALSRCGERFRATPFLVFSIKVATDRIRSQS